MGLVDAPAFPSEPTPVAVPKPVKTKPTPKVEEPAEEVTE